MKQNNTDKQLVNEQIKQVNGQIKQAHGQIELVNGQIKQVHGQIEQVNGQMKQAHEQIEQVSQQNKKKAAHQRPQLKQQKKKKKIHLSFQQQYQMGETKIRKQPQRSQIIAKSQQPLQLKLRNQYLQKIDKLKTQLIQFEYSYWDGKDVVKILRCRKVEKVRDVIRLCGLELSANFKNLIHLDSEDLLFVLRDFIIPHSLSLYEIEVLELKTKTNELLFNLKNLKIKKDGKELTLSKNQQNPIRIIQKSKYQKNKTLFPFCNWQSLKITN